VSSGADLHALSPHLRRSVADRANKSLMSGVRAPKDMTSAPLIAISKLRHPSLMNPSLLVHLQPSKTPKLNWPCD